MFDPKGILKAHAGLSLPQSMLTGSQVKRDARMALEIYKRIHISNDPSHLGVPRNESSVLRDQLDSHFKRLIED